MNIKYKLRPDYEFTNHDTEWTQAEIMAGFQAVQEPFAKGRILEPIIDDSWSKTEKYLAQKLCELTRMVNELTERMA